MQVQRRATGQFPDVINPLNIPPPSFIEKSPSSSLYTACDRPFLNAITNVKLNKVPTDLGSQFFVWINEILSGGRKLGKLGPTMWSYKIDTSAFLLYNAPPAPYKSTLHPRSFPASSCFSLFCFQPLCSHLRLDSPQSRIAYMLFEAQKCLHWGFLASLQSARNGLRTVFQRYYTIYSPLEDEVIIYSGLRIHVVL